MATAGQNLNLREEDRVPGSAQGAEYGLPSSQLKGEGGAVRVEVPASVADHFEAAQERLKQTGADRPVTEIDPATHKSGFEPVVDRARNLTAVAEAKMQSGGEAETRTPDIGFPARPHVE